jgi:hypothetical protein
VAIGISLERRSGDRRNHQAALGDGDFQLFCGRPDRRAAIDQCAAAIDGRQAAQLAKGRTAILSGQQVIVNWTSLRRRLEIRVPARYPR